MAIEKKNAVEEKPVEKVEVQVQEEKDLKIQEVKVDVPVQVEKNDLSDDVVKDADVKGKIKNISIKLPEDIHRKLKAKCAMDGESTGNVMKKLIDDYIKCV